MKIKHFVNLHKGSTFLFVLGLMIAYQNFTIGPWVYLSLHGTYGILWLLKDQIFPDKQWEQKIPLPIGLVGLGIISLYWVAPFILVSSRVELPPSLISAAITLNILGVFLHYSSDTQKYYTLKYQSGLITEGFFARCRNTNYLGEVLIYLAFAMLAMHWLPFVILGGFILGMFIPNMLKKDRSLSRYADFESYKAHSGLLFPQLFNPNPQETQQSSGV